MSETLLSVGLDIGTTSTQMVVSKLTIENKASVFAVPELEIAQRNILYQSPIHFTPLLDASHMDAQALKAIIEEEYRKADLNREKVDTGAVIITGETSRKENAEAVLQAIAHLAGDFVAAAAGPDLESVLAAKGAGAVEYSEKTGETVLHMDIGGGTANLCLLQNGEVVQTGCLNVGGRLVKAENGLVSYVSPVLKGLTDLREGEPLRREQAEELAGKLVQALEMAAGLREPGELLHQLTTQEVETAWNPPKKEATISFSGGVADCIEKDVDRLTFGDIGPLLGREIRKSKLCQGKYRLGSETIRATVIGAGCHSAQLSGSTVFYQNIAFPLKNLPVVSLVFPCQEAGAAFRIPRLETGGYEAMTQLARELAENRKERPLVLCMEVDMAKALGNLLALQLGREASILCIDRVQAKEGSFLDIGAPVENAIPVVVKTLILNKEETQ